MARRQRVGDKAGERRLGHDGELRRGGDAGPDERRARKDQRVRRRKRIDSCRSVVVEKSRAEADAAEILAKARFLNLMVRASAAGQIDVQGATEKSVHPYPPASADRTMMR